MGRYGGTTYRTREILWLGHRVDAPSETTRSPRGLCNIGILLFIFARMFLSLWSAFIFRHSWSRFCLVCLSSLSCRRVDLNLGLLLHQCYCMTPSSRPTSSPSQLQRHSVSSSSGRSADNPASSPPGFPGEADGPSLIFPPYLALGELPLPPSV